MTVTRVIACVVAFACMSAGAFGCSSVEPTPVSAITFGLPSPTPGSTIIATGTPPGVFIPRGSGRIAIPLTVTSGRDLPWAELWLYFYRNGNTTGNDYCGQNLPDAPTWGPFPKGQTVLVTITGFQVLPSCDVTGIRAMLHTRNNGNLTPPTASETVVEAMLPVTYFIRQ